MALRQFAVQVARLQEAKRESWDSHAMMAPVSRRYRGACLISASLITCAVAFWTSSTMATEPEPDYFIYHGQHKSLALDSTQIAVRTSSLAPASGHAPSVVSPGLASHGFATSDVVARPARGWAILNARNVLNAVRAKAQSIGRSAPGPPSKAAAIHALIASVLESGDPSVAFISPVFRDENGGVVLLS